MYKSQFMKLLPAVGERRRETPTMGGQGESRPQLCTVVEVHPEHLWYRVRFDHTGHCECYKVPNPDPDSKKVSR